MMLSTNRPESAERGLESGMGKLHLEGMEFDELWLLHEQLTRILSDRITAEKHELEKRLARLNPEDRTSEANSTAMGKRPRRKYPKVMPKYFNPLVPGETWSGRGKQPRWLVAALKSGHKLEELRIPEQGDRDQRRGRPRGPNRR
jgi:DNA-binding protein H-NS